MDLLLGMSELAGFLGNARPNPSATVAFDVLSDGLVWSDEYPNDQCVSDEAELVFRYLLKFRTSALEGHPIETLAALWEDAKIMFPDWPGFDSHRTTSCPELLQLIDDGRDRQVRFFDSD